MEGLRLLTVCLSDSPPTVLDPGDHQHVVQNHILAKVEELAVQEVVQDKQIVAVAVEALLYRDVLPVLLPATTLTTGLVRVHHLQPTTRLVIVDE